MGFVNKVGQNMKDLKVTLPARGHLPEMTGRVTGVNKNHQTLYVTWDWAGHPIDQSYNCEKFETRIGDNGLFLVLHLD